MKLMSASVINNLSNNSVEFLDALRCSLYSDELLDSLYEWIDNSDWSYIDTFDSQIADCLFFEKSKLIFDNYRRKLHRFEMFVVFNPVDSAFSAYDASNNRMYSIPFTLFFTKDGDTFVSGHAPDQGEAKVIELNCYKPICYNKKRFTVYSYIVKNQDGMVML